ncbi:MAG: helix-turn-helix transcriptional regulator [Fimbriimonas sp.]|nr:helix-turn-helix transcriptional regulator [Fimbriimonas sp.]
MDDLSFIVATHVPHATHSVAKHLVGYATIQYMEYGSLLLRYDDRHYSMEGKWFWTAYPGPYTVFHRADGSRSWNHRHLAFQGPLVSQWMSDGLWPTEPQPAPEGKEWSAYFDEMARLALTPSRWGRLRGLNMLEGLLLELAEARQAPDASDSWLAGVLTDLRSGGMDYQAIADRSGVSLSTLRRRFIQATGTPLHKHALLAKTAKARTLLVETELPVKAIADSLGYQNVYFFSRQFKRFTGVSPATYRGRGPE